MILFIYIYRGGKRLIKFLRKPTWLIVYLKFKLNKVNFRSDFKSKGIPITNINFNCEVSVGYKFEMNNGLYHNIIGRQQPCIFNIGKGAKLLIGNNVGMSATAIVCYSQVIIEDNVRIGGGTVIYDTNFHSLYPDERTVIPEIIDNVVISPILIKKNAFIGAHSTILKGVTIGQNAIIGACSVVSKSIPDDEIWGGNPAKFIRKIDYSCKK